LTRPREKKLHAASSHFVGACAVVVDGIDEWYGFHRKVVNDALRSLNASELLNFLEAAFWWLLCLGFALTGLWGERLRRKRCAVSASILLTLGRSN
jgi:hypothetical protein